MGYVSHMGRRGLGFLALGVGAFMGLGIALNLGEGFGVGAYVLALGFCSVLPVGVGVALLKAGGTRRLAERAEHAEHAVAAELLRLAELRGGRLTVAEVMAHLDLSKGQAESALEQLCRQGLADYRVSESGVLVYHFGTLIGAEEKRLAEGVLDG
jgi:hypothetical protein